MTGFIKLHRKMLDWGWYSDINTSRLFIHLLLKASSTNRNYRDIRLKKGQLITSIKLLSEQTGLTVRQVRTCIDKLKKTNEVTTSTNMQYSIITIKKWTEYQAIPTNIENSNAQQMASERQRNDKSATNESQTDDKQMTTVKECKKVIKKNNLKVIPKKEQFISNIELDLQQPLANWLEYRKDLKDQKQWEYQYKKLKSFSNPHEAVEFSIGQGYRGLFEPKPDFQQQKQGTVAAIREVGEIIEQSGLGDVRPPSKYF